MSAKVNTPMYKPMEETDDDDKMVTWKRYYETVSQNYDQKKYGHANFHYHYACYLFFSAYSGMGSAYNPTPAMAPQIYRKSVIIQETAKDFFEDVLHMNDIDVGQCVHKGNAILFKRKLSVTQYTKEGGIIPIWRTYVDLKEDIEVHGF